MASVCSAVVVASRGAKDVMRKLIVMKKNLCEKNKKIKNSSTDGHECSFLFTEYTDGLECLAAVGFVADDFEQT